MLKHRHIDASALETYPFGLQQEPLIEAEFARKGDASSSPQNSLPGQSWHLVQDLSHLAGISGIARRFRNGAVGADFSPGNPPDHGCNSNRERQLGRGFARHGSG